MGRRLSAHICLQVLLFFAPTVAHARSPTTDGERLYPPCVVCHEPNAWGSPDERIPNLAEQMEGYFGRADLTRQFRECHEPGLKDPDVQRSYHYVDTGLIAANVYLSAALWIGGLVSWQASVYAIVNRYASPKR